VSGLKDRMDNFEDTLYETNENVRDLKQLIVLLEDENKTTLKLIHEGIKGNTETLTRLKQDVARNDDILFRLAN
jgi:regulator of replication initiation timing